MIKLLGGAALFLAGVVMLSRVFTQPGDQMVSALVGGVVVGAGIVIIRWGAK